MHRYVVVLAMILACCQAYTLEGLHVDVPIKIEDMAQGGRLVKMLEKLKEVLKNGNKKLGIPVLDPFKANHLDLHLKQAKLVELEGTLDNVRAVGLSNYVVEKGDLAIIGLLANVSLSWDEIDLMTRYNFTSGKLVDTIAFYGDGSIAAVIKGLQVTVDMKIGVNDGKLYAKELILHAHLAKLDFEITGLFNDVEMSRLISKIISELIPKMLEDYQKELSKAASPLVQKLLNKILKNLKLSDILG